MSLVGPRPERPHFVRAVQPGRARIHRAAADTGRPDRMGSGPPAERRHLDRVRARFDNYYIEYWSFWLDLVVLGRTVTSIAAEAASTAGRAIRSRQSTGGN